MSPTACKPDFTIQSANETLPLVQMIVGDIVQLSVEISDTRQRLSYLTQGRPKGQDDLYSSELSSIQQVTDEKSDRLDAVIDELLQLNVDVSHAEDGFVDFPARRHDRDICLCWQLGESEVMHWHDVNEGCECRRLVDLPLVELSVRRQYTNPA